MGARSHNGDCVNSQREAIRGAYRLGREDEIGALKLITPEKRRQVALVKDGLLASLAAYADEFKAVDNPNPYEVTMQGVGSDRLAINDHGIAHTCLDSMAHINERGEFCNGDAPPQDAVVRDRHAKISIHSVKNGVFTRWVLIDIPRLKCVAHLEPGTPIYVEDLGTWEKRFGVRVTAGDALFVRTSDERAARRSGAGCAGAPKGGDRPTSTPRSSLG
jgi:hypothetical protein